MIMKFLLLILLFSLNAFAQKEGTLEDQIAITNDQVDRFIKNMQDRSGSQTVTSREYLAWSKDFVIKTERNLMKFEADLKHRIFNVLKSKISRHQAIFDDTNIDDRQKNTLLNSSLQDIKTIMPTLQKEYNNILENLVRKYTSDIVPNNYNISNIYRDKAPREGYGKGEITIDFFDEKNAKYSSIKLPLITPSRERARNLRKGGSYEGIEDAVGHSFVSGKSFNIFRKQIDSYNGTVNCPLIVPSINANKFFSHLNYINGWSGADFSYIDRSKSCHNFLKNNNAYLNLLAFELPANDIFRNLIKGCSVKICIELKKGDIAFILSSIKNDLFRDIPFYLPILDSDYDKSSTLINLAAPTMPFNLYDAILQKIDYSQEIQNWPFSDEY